MGKETYLREIMHWLRARLSDAEGMRLAEEELLSDETTDRVRGEMEQIEVSEEALEAFSEQLQQSLNAEDTERLQIQEGTEKLTALEKEARNSLSKDESAILLDCLNSALSWASARQAQVEGGCLTGRTDAFELVLKVGEVLVTFLQTHPVSLETLGGISETLEKYLSTFRVSFFALPSIQQHVRELAAELRVGSPGSPMVDLPDSVPQLLEVWFKTKSRISLNAVADIYDLIDRLRNNGQLNQAQLLEKLVEPIEFDALITDPQKTKRFQNKQLLSRLIAKYGQELLASQSANHRKLRFTELLGVLEEDAHEIGGELMEAFSNRLSVEGLNDLERSAFESSLLGLTAALYQTKLSYANKDKSRILYHAQMFCAAQPQFDVWEKLDLIPAWTKKESEQVFEWLKALKAEVKAPSKAFEGLTVAELSAVDAKQILKSLDQLPVSLTSAIVQTQLVTPANLEQVESDLRASLGPEVWSNMDDDARRCLVTAGVASSLPNVCDLSCAVVLYWKALEVQLRSSIFRSYWQVIRNPLPMQIMEVPRGFDSEYFLQKWYRWDRANEKLTLKPMLFLLQDACDDEYCKQNKQTARLRGYLKSKFSNLIAKPETIALSVLIDGANDLRNPAAHSKVMSWDHCKQSQAIVINAIIAVSQPKRNTGTRLS